MAICMISCMALWLFLEAKLTIGPTIDNGFYYDFDHAAFSREDLDKIEAEMKKGIKEGAAAICCDALLKYYLVNSFVSVRSKI